MHAKTGICVQILHIYEGQAQMCGLSSCWKKNKQLLLRNDVVVPSTKHTEDDHICEPITEEGTLQIFLCISMPTYENATW